MIAPMLNHNGTGQEPGPGIQAAAMTGRDYLSYSQVTTYQSCKLKFFYTYVEGRKPEAISAAMLLGSAIHKAIEEHFQTLLAAESPLTVEQMMTTYRRHWQEEVGDIPIQYPREDTEDTMASTAQRMLEQFVQSPLAKPTGKVLGLEESIRFRLSPDIPDILSRVDMLEHCGDELVITDFKTARSMWSQETAEEHADQLNLYGAAAEPMARELGAKVKLRFIVLTKAKTPKVEEFPITHDPDRIQRVSTVIQRVFQDMQTGVVYPNPSVMNCAGCPHQGKCKSWHRIEV